MEVYYFTFTGNSRKIAEWISQTGAEIKEIVAPKYPYVVWLILSFVPYLKIKCRFEQPKNNVIVLCFPKWTLNCPPITYFLEKANLDGKSIYMIICYGGFDETRYANFYKKLAERRAKEVKVMLVKRRRIVESEEDVRKKVLEWVKGFTQ